MQVQPSNCPVCVGTVPHPAPWGWCMGGPGKGAAPSPKWYMEAGGNCARASVPCRWPGPGKGEGGWWGGSALVAGRGGLAILYRMFWEILLTPG